MNIYIREMQERLRTKKIGYKKEFLREMIRKKSRVKGREITLTYKLPIAKKPSGGGNGGEFFKLLQMGGSEIEKDLLYPVLPIVKEIIDVPSTFF